MEEDPEVPPEVDEVFCKCFRHWKTRKLIFPKRGKVFRFLVKRRKRE